MAEDALIQMIGSAKDRTPKAAILAAVLILVIHTFLVRAELGLEGLFKIKMYLLASLKRGFDGSIERSIILYIIPFLIGLLAALLTMFFCKLAFKKMNYEEVALVAMILPALKLMIAFLLSIPMTWKWDIHNGLIASISDIIGEIFGFVLGIYFLLKVQNSLKEA